MGTTRIRPVRLPNSAQAILAQGQHCPECSSVGGPKFEGEFGDSGWRDFVCFWARLRQQLESLRLLVLKPDQVALDPSSDVVSENDALPSPAQLSQVELLEHAARIM